MNFSDFLCGSISQSCGEMVPKICYCLLGHCVSAGPSCAVANRCSNTMMGSPAEDAFKSTAWARRMLFWVMLISKKQPIPSLPQRGNAEVPLLPCGVKRKQRVERRGGPPCLGVLSQCNETETHCDTGPHSDFWAVQEYRGISFCTDHIVPVTRATRHRSRQNTQRSHQLLGRANAFGCLKQVSHVDFLIMTCF